jgi:riboflavin biosynthesis pyrimidine reductase
MSDSLASGLPYPDGAPLELLFERADLRRFDLPEPLVLAYGGPLGFHGPCLYANFVASVDGVVALDVAAESGGIISRASEADRFVMGLLRACADAVLIGAGTFRKASKTQFHAEAIYPPAAPWFAQVRRRLGLRPKPRFVLVTGSGAIDPTGPALEDALVFTTGAGERRLRGRVPSSTRIVASTELRLPDVVSLLRSEGLSAVLTEGGPSLFAELVASGLVDELFVTASPVLFGRLANDRRKSLSDGLDLGGTPLELLSVRRHGSYLFSRYALRTLRS